MEIGTEGRAWNIQQRGKETDYRSAGQLPEVSQRISEAVSYFPVINLGKF